MKARANTPGKKIVPVQYTGSRTGAAYTVICNSPEEAKALFSRSKERFFDINNWSKLSGMAGANFKMLDARGNPATLLQRDEYIRIDLPGPGTFAGEGYDWVIVEDIQHVMDTNVDEEWIAFRVRPVQAPFSSSGDIAHFYTQEATSTFILKRMNCHLTAAEGGRNEKPNIETENALDNIRNAAVANGAILGVAQAQWKTLMHAILEEA